MIVSKTFVQPVGPTYPYLGRHVLDLSPPQFSKLPRRGTHILTGVSDLGVVGPSVWRYARWAAPLLPVYAGRSFQGNKILGFGRAD